MQADVDPTTNPRAGLLQIEWQSRPIDIEFAWVGREDGLGPVFVFLHEGLGSLSMWKDFPDRLCQALGVRGFVYSRPGYGQSTPRPKHESWHDDFMHKQAREVLPAVLVAAGLQPREDQLWLFGHSDGGSISLIYAASFPDCVSGLVVLAPHIMVEDLTIKSIQEARKAYQVTDLPQKLGRYHADPDSAFWGWNDIWLKPSFRDWTIEGLLSAIACPVLAVQGMDDQYGTMAQIRGIKDVLPTTQLLELAQCGHSPHRDQPDQLISEVTSFFSNHNQSGDNTC